MEAGSAQPEKSPSPVRRRAATPGPVLAPPPIPRTRLVAMAAAILIVGVGIGGVIERQRHKSQDIVAVVNGNIIRKQFFYHRLEQTAGVPVIRALVSDQMILAYAKSLNLLPSEKLVDSAVKDISYNPNFLKQLQQKFETPDELKYDLQVQLAKAAILSKGAPVTDAQMQAYYYKNADPHTPGALFYHPEQANIAIIVAPSSKIAYDAQHDLLLGVSFSDVAHKYSVDASAADGGLLKAAVLQGGPAAKIPGLLPLVFGTPIGQTTTPHEFTINGTPSWWIIRVLDHATTHTDPYDQVREQCRIGVMMSRVTASSQLSVDAAFNAWKKKHVTAQAFWPQYGSTISALTGGN